LVELGAVAGSTNGDDEVMWTVMRDPDGNGLYVTDP
jgi:hypothetical protein